MTGHHDGPRHLEYRCRQVSSRLGLHTDEDIERVLIAEATAKSKEELGFDPDDDPDEAVEMSFNVDHHGSTSGKQTALGTLNKRSGSAVKTKWVRLKLPLGSVEVRDNQAPTQFRTKPNTVSPEDSTSLSGLTYLSSDKLSKPPSQTCKLKLICKSKSDESSLNRSLIEGSRSKKGRSTLTPAQLEWRRKISVKAKATWAKWKAQGYTAKRNGQLYRRKNKEKSLNAHG